jgi:sugar-specific transcriptional regulator TrmB
MKFHEFDAFCDTYGHTINNLVWGHFLTWSEVAVGDMAKEIGISRPKAYQIVDEFIKKGYVIKDRVIGRTQLYKLNHENEIVKIYIRNFKECLNMVVKQYSTKKKPTTAGIRISASVRSV